MPYVEQTPPERAQGLLRREYQAARRRAGRIWNIVSVQSRTPQALRDSMRLYTSVMHGPSPLSRAQREMLAVVTSQTNGCHY